MTLLLNVLAYVADVWILGSYFLMVRGRAVSLFNWANAVGCIPLAAVDVIGHVWPALVVTVAFGVIGLVGLVRR